MPEPAPSPPEASTWGAEGRRAATWDRLPLRAKIGALVVLGAALPLAVAQSVTFVRAQEVAEERTAALLETRAELLAAELDAFNRLYLAAARRVARLPEAASVLTTSDAGDLVHLRSHLAAWPATDENVLAAAVADPRGRIVAAWAPDLFSDLPDRRYFQLAAAGTPVVSDPFVAGAPEATSALVAYAAPIGAGDGRVVGVSVVLVRAAGIWRALRAGNGGAAPGSFSVLCDRLGIRVANSLRDDLVFRPTVPLAPDDARALVREGRFGSATAALVAEPVPAAELAAAAAADLPPQRAFRRYSGSNGQVNLAAARRLSTAPWTVFHHVPVASVAEPARRVAWSFLPGALLGVLAIAAALVVGGRIARPVTELAEAVDAVARGERAQVVLRGDDELTHLAARFNEMAHAVRGSRDELELRVRERTQELSRANTEIERADRLKSQFLANMSHELRTPLNSIIGFSELLAEQLDGALGPVQARHLDEVQASGRHLLQLINDILDLSKIEAGHVALELGAVDPATAVGDAVALVVPSAGRKSIQLRATTPPLPPVRADARKLRQILLNLLSNAIKFAPEGSVVEVAAVPTGDAIRFLVADQGPGIDEALRRRLFQPFVQGESPLVKKHEGTGLGLAICRRLVHLQGGEISVDSEPGRGATFSFSLPCASPLAERSAADGVGRVVLLVEDGPRRSAALRDALGSAGFRVVVAPDGVDAWEVAARMRPSAIVALPDGSDLRAYGLVDELGRRDATRHVPIVLGPFPRVGRFLAAPPAREALLDAVAELAPAGGDGRPRTVLVIEGDPGARAGVARLLEPAGYRVLTAPDGRGGIALAAAERPDAVLVALVLPDVSALDVLAALAGDERTRTTPAVVLTSAELAPEEQVRLAAGARATARTPEVDELLRAVRRALAHTSRASEGATAVVIDDSDANRELARAMLERRGWRVLLADGGDAGLALVRRERPALVVCDLAMPRKDGFAVARELKGDPATARIPLLALTALAMSGDERRAREAGFDAYLTKPIDQRALDDTLRSMIALGARRGEGSGA